MLTDAGRRVLLVEARERIGGRVWTDHSFGAIPDVYKRQLHASAAACATLRAG